jgi:fluoride exporter
MIARFLLICLGGAVGSGARYAMSTAFPLGTILVNVIGSFAIALIVDLIPATDLRLFLTVGILGGFTTYSSFNEETLLLLRAGNRGLALLNLGGTVLACLLAGAAGMAVARLIR